MPDFIYCRVKMCLYLMYAFVLIEDFIYGKTSAKVIEVLEIKLDLPTQHNYSVLYMSMACSQKISR